MLFVLHLQGMALVIDQEDLDLAVGAVVLVVGGAIGEDVLVADGVVDLREVSGSSPWKMGLKLRPPVMAAKVLSWFWAWR